MTKKLPKSVRKFIRGEKGRIRRQFSDVKDQDKLILEIYQKYFPAQNPIVVVAKENVVVKEGLKAVVKDEPKPIVELKAKAKIKSKPSSVPPPSGLRRGKGK